MDFFSKLGKKATETYQITKEKATTISEELKLKGKISDAKDCIEDLYKEIGKKVFEEMKSGKDVIKDEIVDKIEEISELHDKIEKIENQILTLKKIKKCSNCGVELEIDAEFCSKCGQQQEKNESLEVHEEASKDAKEAEVIEVKNIENSENVEEKKEEE